MTSISAQIAVVPLGHLMALTLTERVFFKGRKWEFTLNPGPFNVKEHMLITIVDFFIINDEEVRQNKKVTDIWHTLHPSCGPEEACQSLLQLAFHNRHLQKSTIW